MAESFLVHIVAKVPGAGVDRCGNNFLVQQVLEELHDPSAVQLSYTVWESIPEHSEHLFHQVYQ